MASPFEVMRKLGTLSACCCWALSLAGCRDSKPAAERSASPPVVSLQAQGWATWPMPNADSRLPNAQNFDARPAGVVLDRVTGLVWQQSVDMRQFTFEDAIQHCTELSLDGHDDWRLPSRLELVSILD